MGKQSRLVRAWGALAAVLMVTWSLSSGPAQAGTDTTAPYFTWVISSVATDDWNLSAAWGSDDADSGVSHTTARWRAKEIGGTWSRWHRPDAWKVLPARAQVTKHLRRGHRYQIQARVIDNAGNRSSWEMVGGARRPRG